MVFNTKQEARTASIESRSSRDSNALVQAASGIASHDWASLVRKGAVTCYVSMDTEPSTDALRNVLLAIEPAVYLPIMKPQRQLAWGRDGDELVRNSYGVLEPHEDSEFAISHVTAMVIPALRAGLDGTRLGRGAGYYDRVLATLPRHSAGGPLRVVVVFDDEVDDSVPHDELDQRVDVIVTPTRIIRLAE